MLMTAASCADKPEPSSCDAIFSSFQSWHSLLHQRLLSTCSTETRVCSLASLAKCWQKVGTRAAATPPHLLTQHVTICKGEPTRFIAERVWSGGSAQITKGCPRNVVHKSPHLYCNFDRGYCSATTDSMARSAGRPRPRPRMSRNGSGTTLPGRLRFHAYMLKHRNGQVGHTDLFYDWPAGGNLHIDRIPGQPPFFDNERQNGSTCMPQTSGKTLQDIF
eukprot:s2549_g4.t1